MYTFASKFIVELGIVYLTLGIQSVQYVATFYRTSDQAVDIAFGLMDSSVPPKEVIPNQIVNLQALTPTGAALPQVTTRNEWPPSVLFCS